MQNIKRCRSLVPYLGFLVPYLVVSTVMAAGVIDSDIQTQVDNLEATWGEVKTVLVALLGFGFAVWALMKVKKYGK